jgi:hypothetical protein
VSLAVLVPASAGAQADVFLERALQDENWEFFFQSSRDKLSANPNNAAVVELLILGLHEVGRDDLAVAAYQAHQSKVGGRAAELGRTLSKGLISVEIVYRNAPEGLLEPEDIVYWIERSAGATAGLGGLSDQARSKVEDNLEAFSRQFRVQTSAPAVQSTRDGLRVTIRNLPVPPGGGVLVFEHDLRADGFGEVDVRIAIVPGKNASHTVVLVNELDKAYAERRWSVFFPGVADQFEAGDPDVGLLEKLVAAAEEVGREDIVLAAAARLGNRPNKEVSAAVKRARKRLSTVEVFYPKTTADLFGPESIEYSHRLLESAGGLRLKGLVRRQRSTVFLALDRITASLKIKSVPVVTEPKDGGLLVAIRDIYIPPSGTEFSYTQDLTAAEYGEVSVKLEVMPGETVRHEVKLLGPMARALEADDWRSFFGHGIERLGENPRDPLALDLLVRGLHRVGRDDLALAAYWAIGAQASAETKEVGDALLENEAILTVLFRKATAGLLGPDDIDPKMVSAAREAKLKHVKNDLQTPVREQVKTMEVALSRVAPPPAVESTSAGLLVTVRVPVHPSGTRVELVQPLESRGFNDVRFGVDMSAGQDARHEVTLVRPTYAVIEPWLDGDLVMLPGSSAPITEPRFSIDPGEHELRVVRGQIDYPITLRIQEGDTQTVSLRWAQASVDGLGDDTLLVDGKPVGDSGRLWLPPGPHEFSVIRYGRTNTEKVTADGAPVSVGFTWAFLEVPGITAEDRLLVGDVDVPPGTEFRVTPGEYTVALRRGKLPAREVQVVAKPGATVQVRLPFCLWLETDIEDATVQIAGREQVWRPKKEGDGLLLDATGNDLEVTLNSRRFKVTSHTVVARAGTDAHLSYLEDEVGLNDAFAAYEGNQTQRLYGWSTSVAGGALLVVSATTLFVSLDGSSSADDGYGTYRSSEDAQTLRAALRQTQEGDDQAETYGWYAGSSAVVGGALLGFGIYWLFSHPTMAEPLTEGDAGASVMPWWDGRTVGVQVELE